MDKFLELYKKLQYEKRSLAMHLEHDCVADWYLFVEHTDSNTIVFEGQHYDLNRLGCNAYVKLYDWFEETFEYMV